MLLEFERAECREYLFIRSQDPILDDMVELLAGFRPERGIGGTEQTVEGGDDVGVDLV